jgi:hypothetical protein
MRSTVVSRSPPLSVVSQRSLRSGWSCSGVTGGGVALLPTSASGSYVSDRITSFVGAILTLAGIVGIVLLVADADSTLFLYTDRLVVGVVGLIVLVPTASLIVIGRALAILGGTDGGRDGVDPVPQDAVTGDPDA